MSSLPMPVGKATIRSTTSVVGGGGGGGGVAAPRLSKNSVKIKKKPAFKLPAQYALPHRETCGIVCLVVEFQRGCSCPTFVVAA